MPVAQRFVRKARYSLVLGRRKRSSHTGPNHPLILSAKKNRTKIKNAWLAMLQTVKHEIEMGPLQTALLHKDWGRVMQLADIKQRLVQVSQGHGLPHGTLSFRDALRQTYYDGAKVGIGVLDKVPAVVRKDYNPDEPRDEHGRWTDGGSEDVFQRWFGFDHASAVKDVSRGESLDDWMTTNGEDLTAEEKAQITSDAETLQRLASNTNSGYKTLFRGKAYESEARFKSEIQRGKEISMDGLTATSTEQKVAGIYADPQYAGGGDKAISVMFEIQNPNGVIGVKSPVGPEVILPHGASYRVAAIRSEHGNYTVSLYSKEKLDRVHKAGSVAMSMSFDALNTATIDFLNNYEMDLITNVSTDTQAAIHDIIVEAFQTGGHPYEQARQIRDLIGLDPQLETAVDNFRTMLENGDNTTALTRALRDRRFDSTLENNPILDNDQIDNMVDRYASRALDYRAERISRTESLRASNQGQKEAWNQAAQQGYLDTENTVQVVLNGPDPCPLCEDIAAMNEDGVGIDETFDVPDEADSDYPPFHPHCTDTVGLRLLSGPMSVEEEEA